MAAHLEDVRRKLAQARTGLLDRRNVVAVGAGWKVVDGQRTDELAIVASVATKRRPEELSPEDLIPSHVDDIRTDVIQTGPIFAQVSRTERLRPAPGGISVAHRSVTAGTFGCLVRRDGRLHILSNNHVLANSNDAAVGDSILQPGPADGGRDPADGIARLMDWVPIVFDGGDDGSSCPVGSAAAGGLNALAALAGSRTRLRTIRLGPEATSEGNLVDCAIAEPLDEGDVTDEIVEVGAPQGTAEGTLGTAVRKSGRTTGLTTGTIEQVDATVRVNFGSGRVATFHDQLMAGAMSQGGDSGSAVLDVENRVVGLLFAGSVNTTVINRIQNVLQALQVSLEP